MNTKKLLIAFVVVFIVLELTNYLIHMVLLSSTYAEEAVKVIFRPEEEMMSKMWIGYIVDIVWSFFFTYIFIKGYENKGIVEGLKYGLYIGLFYMFGMAYGSYVVYPLPYSLVLQWFIYGMIQCLFLGVVVAALYKPKEEAPSEAPAAE